LERHYENAAVDARHTRTGFDVTTQNVRRLRLHGKIGSDRAVTLAIDGQQLNMKADSPPRGPRWVDLERVGNRWAATGPASGRPVEKSPGLQGPIDDAFTDAFVCIRGTGTPWHEATGRYAAGALDRFRGEWDKYLRGTLPVKDDTAVTEADIRDKHLILFGDPASNSLIVKVLPKLPLTWTKEGITFAGASGSAAEHVPVLIYPNPLNPGKYVVLNSGHTFHVDAFQGTNALLYPRLGDLALLRLTPTANDPLATATVTAGLFDEFWQVPRP
jgi:hypothetical protein